MSASLCAKLAVTPPFPFTVAVVEAEDGLDTDTEPVVDQDWKTCVESGLAVKENWLL